MLKTILLLFLLASATVMAQPPKEPPPGKPAPMAPLALARGADISWLPEMEAAGRKFYTSDGTQKDLLDILKEYCIDAIRIRVWVNPVGGWSGKQDVINLAKRAHAKNFRLMIDFHYSDSWADPGQQTVPAAWANYSVTQLEQAVAAHTTDILNALKQENISVDWIQIGNETNDGMLWPTGKASTNMANYAKYVKSGSNAAKAVYPQAKTIVHVANGFDNELFKWNIGGLVQNGTPFDVIAMSLYPEYQSWDSLLTLTKQNMLDMESRYHKPILISEIGLGVGYPTQSKAFIEKTISQVQSLPNQQGLGVFWWEPQAYDWRGYTKVAWLNDGKPSSAMDGFKTGCPEQPTQMLTPEHLRIPISVLHKFDLLGRAKPSAAP